MAWRTEEFGSCHEGEAGAVLADGSEPGPAYFDVGSGSYMPSTTEWWAYDGDGGRPVATGARAACSCGWRGTRLYPIDWAQVAEDRYHEIEGPYEDWATHIDDVEARQIPLPQDISDLTSELEERLAKLADDAPLAALRAAAGVERATRWIASSAARQIQLDELSWSKVAEALGLTEEKARSQVLSYARRH
ncbi:hypothetical protein ACFU7T_08615 [Streptomyces sp. NPDC057555]|uniref:hypothetical protein n=1 Tax=Streptomyces sp. NPDC057555 TaxID=3346166 RepID=UPI0036CA9FA1